MKRVLSSRNLTKINILSQTCETHIELEDDLCTQDGQKGTKNDIIYNHAQCYWFDVEMD